MGFTMDRNSLTTWFSTVIALFFSTATQAKHGAENVVAENVLPLLHSILADSAMSNFIAFLAVVVGACNVFIKVKKNRDIDNE